MQCIKNKKCFVNAPLIHEDILKRYVCVYFYMLHVCVKIIATFHDKTFNAQSEDMFDTL